MNIRDFTMFKCKFKEIIIFSMLILNTMSAPTTNPDPYTIKENNYELPTTKINPSTTPLSDLIQIQTDAIKKILSTSLNSPNQERDFPPSSNKCEDIESGIKESIQKSTAQEEILLNTFSKDFTTEFITEEPKRGDTVNEDIIIKEQKNQIPNARTLFSLYPRDFTRTNINLTPSPVSKSENVPEKQNIILIPCIDRVIQNATRKELENKQDLPNFKLNQAQSSNQHELIHSIDNSEDYILEKVYSRRGYLLYYMYRPNSQNQEQTKTILPPFTVSTSTPTTTTTDNSLPDPVYKEQLKFVIQMPYANSEQLLPYGYKFDQYAYYPPELQPSYVNGPIPYKPTFHMIRTLVIPNEYNKAENVLNKSNNQNIKNDQ